MPPKEKVNREMILEVSYYYPVHGIASLLANHSMEYREEEVSEILGPDSARGHEKRRCV